MQPNFKAEQNFIPHKNFGNFLVQDNYKSLNKVSTYCGFTPADFFVLADPQNTVAVFKIKWK